MEMAMDGIAQVEAGLDPTQVGQESGGPDPTLGVGMKEPKIKKPSGGEI